MTDLPQEKKGMSKGCMIALIVVGSVAVLIAAIAITCWMKKDDMARYGARMVVSDFKTKIAEAPIEGIDTVEVNSIVDSFNVLLDSTELRLDDFGTFFQRIQSIAADKAVDSVEVILMMNAMIEYFPELEGMQSGGGSPMQDEPAVQDSVMEDSL